jgi:hypothetical protein
MALLVSVTLGFGGWLGVSGRGPAAPEVKMTPDGTGATIIDVTLAGVETSNSAVSGVTYTALSLPGQPAMTDVVGSPALPQIVSTIGLPDHANVSVEVLEAAYETFHEVLVMPAQKPLTDHDEADFTIDPAAYRRDELGPARVAAVASQTVWRDLPLANVVISPVAYNPARRELRVYSHLRIRVNHHGFAARRQVEPWMAYVYRNSIDNFDQLDLDISWNENPGVRYLVIAHSNYAGGWLDSLVNWHHKRGIEARVIAKSGWTDTEVKDSVRAEYNRNNPAVLRWVLLVGEYSEVPQHNYPSVGGTDMWYADLLPPSSTDNYFDIGIGRFSPSSVADLGNQIQKTLKFQRDPPTGVDWFSKATLAAHSEEYPLKYSACSRGIYQYPYAYYHYTFDTIFGGTTGTNAMVSADINEGRVVVNYRGHGSETDWSGWDHGGASWTASNINALTNGDLTPVVFNCCCLNHVLSTGTCLGEAWMRKYPGGAVASLGASEASYTIPNHGWDSLLFRCLGDTYTNNVPGVRAYVCPTWDLGWMLNNADAYIVRYYGSIGVDNAQMYGWLGDPALNVWTGMPIAPDVVYPPAVPMGDYDVNVSVTRQGSPVANALVCLWKQGEFYATAYTNSGGTATVHINSLTPGEFAVTVTGHTILPFEGTCLARTSGTAYVTYLRHVVDDSAGGNNDGSVNPGETINLPTWVKNHGDSTARSLSARLTIADPFITLTDSVKSYGDVPAHDSAYTGTNGFGFAVAPGCTNGHMVHFVMQCRDVYDSVWISHVYLRVGAPSLVYVGTAADDNVPGGNGNGRLDPNETADLIVTLRNVGFGNAANVTAVLRSGDTRLVVGDSLGNFGTIPAEGTGTNDADRFTVTTLAMAPETQVSCTLHVTCGGIQQTMPFMLMVGEIRSVDPIPDGPRTPALYYAYDNVDTFYVQSPEFNWVEIRGVGTPVTLSDDQTVVVNLPTAFGPFRFYGQNYTQVSICGNGWVGLGSTTSSAYSNTALPSTSLPPMFCLNWDDLYPPTGGGVRYYHDEANHRFVVQWDSVAYYGNRSVFEKNQVILYDTTVAAVDGNCVAVLQYLTANQTNSATVGEQDPTRAIAIQALFDNVYHRGSAPIVAGRAIKFTTDPPVVGVGEPAAGTARLPRSLRIGATPNPVRVAASISWQLPAAGRVKLAVYDVTGRLVRTLVNGPVAAGDHLTPWDSRDDAGRLVANGMYLYRLETEGGKLATKAVVLR